MRNMHAALTTEMADPAMGDEPVRFAALLARYQRPVFAYLYHMMGNADDAEDMTQETFLKAYCAPQHGEAHPNVLAWLYRIASNTVLDELRRRQRIRWLPWTHLVV